MHYSSAVKAKHSRFVAESMRKPREQGFIQSSRKLMYEELYLPENMKFSDGIYDSRTQCVNEPIDERAIQQMTEEFGDPLLYETEDGEPVPDSVIWGTGEARADKEATERQRWAEQQFGRRPLWGYGSMHIENHRSQEGVWPEVMELEWQYSRNKRQ